jgi:hypothetical protein
MKRYSSSAARHPWCPAQLQPPARVGRQRVQRGRRSSTKPTTLGVTGELYARVWDQPFSGGTTPSPTTLRTLAIPRPPKCSSDGSSRGCASPARRRSTPPTLRLSPFPLAHRLRTASTRSPSALLVLIPLVPPSIPRRMDRISRPHQSSLNLGTPAAWGEDRSERTPTQKQWCALIPRAARLAFPLMDSSTSRY